MDDLSWWQSIKLDSRKTIGYIDFDLEIFTHASLTGWGAIYDNKSSHGFLNDVEQKSSINYFELLAASFGLKTFVEQKRDCRIPMHIDNTTAIFYINRMSGLQYPHLNTISREFWQWCKIRNI